MGDVVPYIFCLGSGGESSKTGQADRARHPDEVRKAEKDCQIGAAPGPSSDALVSKPDLFSRVTDYDYYLSQQILPPIERLCERIEGTDRSRLAECLGKPVFSGMSVVVVDQSCTSRVLCHTVSDRFGPCTFPKSLNCGRRGVEHHNPRFPDPRK